MSWNEAKNDSKHQKLNILLMHLCWSFKAIRVIKVREHDNCNINE
jgi:hypothetical protein